MTISRTCIASLLAALAVAGCTGDESDLAGTDDAPSFEELRTRSEHVIDGNTRYVVEWDLVLTLDELHAYYDENIVGKHGGARSSVDRVNNHDNVWLNGEQTDLTYCVSTNFGSSYSRIVNNMAQAASEWAAAGNVKFRYKPADDASCTATTAGVNIAVMAGSFNNSGPWASAFGPAQRHGVLFVDLAAIDRGSPYAPNLSLVGTLRHELGHILGLHHEHDRAATGGGCSAAGTYSALNAYDQDSVMMYPQCGNPNSAQAISALDKEGIHQLYGPEPARPYTFFTATCQNHVPRFALSWFRFRGVGESTFEAHIWRGNGWELLSDGPSTGATYEGVSGRTDWLSVRACNFFGCGSFSDAIAVKQTCP